MRLMDMLSDLFQECVKSAEKTFLNHEKLTIEIKVEAETGYSVEHDSATTPGSVEFFFLLVLDSL